MQVMVIEDDEAIRECVRDILEMESVQVVTAIHGLEALNMLRELTVLPQVILVDLTMPVMSGEQFIARLKDEGNTIASIPVIVMSAVAKLEVEGAVQVLRKPLELETILGAVRPYLKI